MKYITRPEPGEYAPYLDKYLNEVPAGADVLQMLHDNIRMVEDLVQTFSPERLTLAHAPDEWTIQDILVHLIDAERVFNYRALRFARNDLSELPAFDQNAFAQWAGANQRTITDILDERQTVRQASITLFSNLDNEALTRRGIARGNLISVRTMAYFIAGHELHHIHSIRANYGA